jgi:hypothetical protein
MLSSHFLPLLSKIAILVHRALSDVVAVTEDSRDEAKEITCALTNENTRRQESINNQ